MPMQILGSTFIKTIASGGRQITLKFATQTDAWRRVVIAPEVKDGFARAMEKAAIPPGATVAIMSETEHPSQKDSYPHYTVTYQDDKGNHITTKHVYP